MNDIETGAFELADEILTATDRLFERLPDAQPWILRIGHRVVDHFRCNRPKETFCVASSAATSTLPCTNKQIIFAWSTQTVDGHTEAGLIYLNGFYGSTIIDCDRR